jgi:hypothetical protein
VRDHTGLFAAAGLFAIGISLVGEDVDRGAGFQGFACSFGHRLKAVAVACIQRDCMGHDQGMLGINRGLHVMGRSFRTRHRHEARLRLWMLPQLLYGCLHRGRVDGGLLLAIGAFHAVQIASQRFAFAHAVLARYGAELRTVDGDPLTSDQPAGTREPHQFCSHRSDSIAVHPSKFGDRLVVWIQPTQQPHQLDVASALGLQTSRRA